MFAFLVKEHDSYWNESASLGANSSRVDPILKGYIVDGVYPYTFNGGTLNCDILEKV